MNVRPRISVVIVVAMIAVPLVLSASVWALDWTQTSQSDFEAGTGTNVDTVSDPGNVTLSQLWSKAPANPVLWEGPLGSWEEGSVEYPTVLYDATEFKMWYDASNGTSRSIGYATSLDGITWTKYAGNPVLTPGSSGSWDEGAVWGPFVLFDGTTYKMWYSGGTPNYKIGYATSPDGITWTKYAGNPVLDLGPGSSWDGIAVDDPTILYNGTEYQMWFMGSDGIRNRIGYATSPDGINWTKFAGNPVLDIGSSGEWDDWSVGNPWVHYNGTEYQMWYAGNDGPGNRIGYATSLDGITWTKYAGNPVLPNGPSGSWEDVHVDGPSVLKVGSTYRMWYTGETSGSKRRIGYAESPPGSEWTKFDSNPVLDLGPGGSWDDSRVSGSLTIFNGTGYQMWYSGFDGSTYRIGFATSPDGITWTKYPGNPVLTPGSSGSWDEGAVWGPFVLFDGTTYKMWYSGGTPNYKIGYATSPDGITWTKYAGNPVLDIGPPGSWDSNQVSSPSVLFDGSMYWMWYSGDSDIGMATSSDGIVWTKYAGNPVLTPAPGTWESPAVHSPSVLFDGSTYRMWYSGNSDIGMATSPDGIAWTKYPRNPVLPRGTPGSWDDYDALYADVVSDGTTYRLWYSGTGDGSVWRIGLANVSEGTSWAKLAVNPVVDLGPSSSWDDSYVSGPSVLYNGTKYMMWYNGQDGGSIVRIGLATSNDGLTWTKYGSNPVLDVGPGGSWDDSRVVGPTVLYNGTTYVMWYSGNNGSNYRIGLATSSDGATWTKDAINPVLDLGPPGSWDSTAVCNPTVLYDGSTYKMWYQGENGTNARIGYATSLDGITWTKYAGNPVLDLGSSGSWDDTHVGALSVVYDGTSHKMWYTGQDGPNRNRIGLATSKDGINWTKYAGNPVLDLGLGGSWDDATVTDPVVLREGTTYKMWYTGSDGANYRIGYASMSYQPSGNLASSVFDSGANGTVWNFINWTEYLPAGTNITMTTRTGDTSVPDPSWSSWSAEMWDETGSPITSPRSRYIQYRATLITANQNVTPMLSEVNINYDLNTAQSPTLLSPPNDVWTTNNTPTFIWSYTDLEGDSQTAFTVQIDDEPLFTSVDYTSGDVDSSNSWWSPSSSIADGIWYWRVRTRDSYDLWSDYSSYWIVNIDTTPPVANAGFDIAVNEDEIVMFDGTASTDNLNISYYNWSFGDGSYRNGTNPTPTHTYTGSGVYSVLLNVTDMVGFWDVDSLLVFVNNVPPVADAGQDQMADEGQVVSFSANASSDTPSDISDLVYVWYLGDGTIKSGMDITHIFTDNGVFNVMLEVRDDDGALSFDWMIVNVSNVAPVADAGGPYSGHEGVPMMFTASAIDPGDDSFTYEWDFDDSDGITYTDATGVSPTWVWEDDFTGNVYLRVTDDDGGVGTDVALVTILDLAPQVDAGGPYSGEEGNPVNLTGYATDTPPDTLTFEWDVDNDGLYDDAVGPNVVWTWYDNGVYIVGLRVMDDDGGMDFDFTTVTISNFPPVVDLGGPFSVDEGYMITFTANATDPGTMDTFTYHWDFGDGSSSTMQNPSHIYADDGNYTVTLTVTDDDGGVGYGSTSVTVTNLDPVVQLISPQSATEDIMFHLHVLASDSGKDKLIFSDNTTLFEIEPYDGTISFLPRDADVGLHYVRIMVEDDDGGVASVDFSIDVQNVNDLPSIISSPPSVAVEESAYEYDVLVWDDDFLTPLGDAITYDLIIQPPGMTIDALGHLTWTPTNTQAAQWWDVVVSISDAHSAVNQSFSVYVANTNDIPVFTSVPITQASERSPYQYQVSVMDEDLQNPSGEVLLFTLASSPMGMVIDSLTGMIMWTPSYEQAGDWDVVVNVSDGESYALQSFVLSVEDRPEPLNHSPLLESPGVTEVEGEVNTYLFQIIYKDEDGDIPQTVLAVIDGIGHEMSKRSGDNYTLGVVYGLELSLSPGTRTYWFKTSDLHGSYTSTAESSLEVKAVEVEEKMNLDLILLIVLLILIIAVLVTLVMGIRGKPSGEREEEWEKKEEESEEIG